VSAAGRRAVVGKTSEIGNTVTMRVFYGLPCDWWVARQAFDAWASDPGAVQLVPSHGHPFDSWHEDKRHNVPTLE